MYGWIDALLTKKVKTKKSSQILYQTVDKITFIQNKIKNRVTIKQEKKIN